MSEYLVKTVTESGIVSGLCTERVGLLLECRPVGVPVLSLVHQGVLLHRTGWEGSAPGGHLLFCVCFYFMYVLHCFLLFCVFVPCDSHM